MLPLSSTVYDPELGSTVPEVVNTDQGVLLHEMIHAANYSGDIDPMFNRNLHDSDPTSIMRQNPVPGVPVTCLNDTPRNCGSRISLASCSAVRCCGQSTRVIASPRDYRSCRSSRSVLESSSGSSLGKAAPSCLHRPRDDRSASAAPIAMRHRHALCMRRSAH
jgi:hypothetical protein